jgi:hypothetical protein
MKITRTLIHIRILAFLAASASLATTLNWTNTNGGFWSVPANWSPNSVPGAADDVFITAAGSYVVTQDVHVAVANLTVGGSDGVQTLTNAAANLVLNGPSTITPEGELGFGGGSLGGTGHLSVGGRLMWGGGTVGGALTVEILGTLTIEGTGAKALNGEGTLVNRGLIAWSGLADIQTGNSARIINEPVGLIDIRNDQSLYQSNGGVITNRGTLRKSAGDGNTVIAVPLHNSGVIDVQSGSVMYTVGSQFNDGTIFTGTGTNLVNAGTTTFSGDISSQNLEIGGGTIGGNSVFSGVVNWTGGTLSSGSLTIAPDGALNIGGSALKHVDGTGMLVNHGQIIWSGPNDILTGNSARIVNEPGGLIDIQNNQSLLIWNGGVITNLGTVRKTAGGGNTLIAVPLDNSGTLDVQSGSITYGSGSQFNNGTAFLGTGTNLLNVGTVTFNGEMIAENLELGGAALLGDGVFRGVVDWTSGPLGNATLTVATNGVLNIKGSATKHLDGTATLVNHGLIAWSGSNDIQTANSARILNQPGAVFEIQNNQSLLIWNGGVITNLGTLRKSAGDGNTVITVPLYNSGTLEVQSGSIAYGSGSQFNDGTSFLGAGTNLVGLGSVTFNGEVVAENLELGGATLLGDGVFRGIVDWTSGTLGNVTLTLATNGVLHIKGSAAKDLVGTATLINYGLVTWSGSNDIQTANSARILNQPGALFEIQNNQSLLIWNGGEFLNAGTLRKSAGDDNTWIAMPLRNEGIVDVQRGTMTFANFTQANGKLHFGLNSLTHFGRIAFTQAAGFNGTLGVTLNGGYSPVAGDAFALIAYPSQSGTFDDFDLPLSHAWQTNAYLYGTDTLTLTVLNSRPLLPPVADSNADEQAPSSFPVGGSDPDTGQSLSYVLLQAPEGAAIHPATGVFTWTPAEAQGPSTNLVTVQVSDDGVPLLTQTQQVTIRVREVNRAPESVPIDLEPVDELASFTLAATLALDPDIPPNTLSFALIDSPPGMTMDENTGSLAWTPTEAQGPSAYTIAMRIADDGSPALAVTNTFTLTVREVNTPPALTPLADCTHVVGAVCWITNSVSDTDLPAQSLTYSLVDAPLGMTIVPTDGLITWAPPLSASPSTHTVVVRVTDDGSPVLVNEQAFVASLIATPSLHIANSEPGLVALLWPAEATAAGFLLQSTTNLFEPASWVDVVGTPEHVAGYHRLTTDVTPGIRVYRLSSGLAPWPTAAKP